MVSVLLKINSQNGFDCWSAYQKFCQRLKKKWQQGKWHLLSQQDQTAWLQRLHRFEYQLQSLGIAATFSLTLLSTNLQTLQAQDPTPNGSEFQVNTYTIGYQSIPRVAMDSDGDFVVVWHSEYQDGSEYGIYAQRYNRDGSPNGSEFQVNSYTTGYQNYPSVAMDSDGDFVIPWQSDGQDGSDYGIFAQRYNSDGSPNGDEFQVNTFTEDYQSFPSVGMDSDGDFVISWSSYYQVLPSVGMDSDGDFVVAWQSYYQDGSDSGIYAQRFGDFGVGIEDSFLEKNPITFYPNPAVSHLYFDFNKKAISFNAPIEVQIYNSLGQLVLTSIIEQEHPELSIEGLNSGLYLVEIRAEGEWIGSEKLMIEK